MCKNAKIRFLLIFVIVITFSVKGNSQSMYGAYGIGEIRYFSTVRAIGMGGGGLALADPLSQNHVNPALWIYLDNVSYSGGLMSEGLNFEKNSKSFSSKQTSLNSFTFSVKAGSRIALGAGLGPFSDKDYSFETQNDNYLRSVEGYGGLSSLYFGAAYKISNLLAFGINYSYIFGADYEDWVLDFVNDEFADSYVDILTQKSGGNLSLGLSVEPTQRFRIGGVFQSSMKLKAEKKVATAEDNAEDIFIPDFEIPFSYGIGIEAVINNRLKMIGDYYFWQYEELKVFEGELLQNFRNTSRISAGFEFDPSNNVSDRFPRSLVYRFGAYYQPLYYGDETGLESNEKFLTAGVSLPFNDNFARCDIGLELGIRSSNSDVFGDEKIIRAFLGISGSEIWFINRGGFRN
ncbi:hypothetical protein ACFL7D_07065 [candidate division KSB1 bacterium]